MTSGIQYVKTKPRHSLLFLEILDLEFISTSQMWRVGQRTKYRWRCCLPTWGIWKSVTMNMYSNINVSLGILGDILPESESVSSKGVWVAHCAVCVHMISNSLCQQWRPRLSRAGEGTLWLQAFLPIGTQGSCSNTHLNHYVKQLPLIVLDKHPLGRGIFPWASSESGQIKTALGVRSSRE